MSKLYAADFGVVGDGISDDTAAIDNLISSALNLKNRNTTLNSNYLGDVEIVFPSGTFIYKGSNLFSNAAVRTSGYKISGEGRNATRILYRPTTKGNYMFRNNDKLLMLTFEDLSFYGDIDNHFMMSCSHGGAQNYVFNRVIWKDWNKVIELTGSNTNSEMTWYSCNFNGTIKKGLYVGTTNTSDQFLNYNFFACNYEVEEGDFIDMSKGGNINIYGGSFIHIGANGGTFFKLQGNSHGRTAQRFVCLGGRFEHRVPTSKLIDCSWGWGNVNFISCNNIANDDGTMETAVRAIFNPGNEAMPIIKFDSSTLGGVHEYHYSLNGFNYPHNVIYDGCHIYAVKDGLNYNSFIKYVDDGDGSNKGSRPRIKFANCRNEKSEQLADSEFGFELTNRGLTSRKIISIKDAYSGMVKRINSTTEGMENIHLPIGAVITKIIAYSPPNVVTSMNKAMWTIKNNEEIPTVISTFSASPYRNGLSFNQDLFYVCDSDEKRQIKVIAGTGVDQVNNKGYILIEYIG